MILPCSRNTHACYHTLQAICGVVLPATVVIDCPTTAALADHIFTLHNPRNSQQPLLAASSQFQLIGSTPHTIQAGQLISRGALESIGGLIGEDAVGSLPLARWDADSLRSLPGSVLTPRFGSYLIHPEYFDSAAFSLSSVEASLIDPQQRLLLECVGETMLTEGISGGKGTKNISLSLQESVGVYVGIASSDYGTMVQQYTTAGAFHATSCAPSVACGRLSFSFAFTGPSISVGGFIPLYIKQCNVCRIVYIYLPIAD